MAGTEGPRSLRDTTSGTGGVTRRRFPASTGAAVGTDTLAWLADRTPPAWAQRRTLTGPSLRLFVPSGDERFTELMQEFVKQAGCDVRFDTVKVTDVPVKLAAEIPAQSGHDIIDPWEAFGYLHRTNLADIRRRAGRRRQAARGVRGAHRRLRQGLAGEADAHPSPSSSVVTGPPRL